MRCLVLGGAGFLGSNLLKHLVQHNFDITVFQSRNASLKRIKQYEDKYKLIQDDFTSLSEEKLDEMTRDVDIVIHLISTSTPATSNQNVFKDASSNILPTINLLDACVKNKIKKFIFYSSGGTVYGDTQEIPIIEGLPTDPISAYGVHKLTIEKYLHLYKTLYGLDSYILRISNPYGEEQSSISGQGLISTLVYKAVNGKGIEIWGDGGVVRDYIYVDDVSNAVIKLIKYSGNIKIYNISSGEGKSINQILDYLKDIHVGNLKIKYMQSRDFDVRINILDNTKAKKELGWAPMIDLKCGIDRMYKSRSID
jgi:UDP-glucose 4-epimerase